MWFTLLAPLIPVLVTQADKLFGIGKGHTKLDTVVKAVTPIVGALAASGKLGTVPPSAMEIAAQVSKVAGQLFPPGTTVEPDVTVDNGEVPGSAEMSPAQVAAANAVVPSTLADAGANKKQLRALLAWALTD